MAGISKRCPPYTTVDDTARGAAKPELTTRYEARTYQSGLKTVVLKRNGGARNARSALEYTTPNATFVDGAVEQLTKANWSCVRNPTPWLLPRRSR